MGTSTLADLVAAADRFTPVLLDTAIRSLAIMGLTGVVALAMRRASAAGRHWVWLLGLMGLLILPLLSAGLPQWRVLPRLEGMKAPVAAFSAPASVLPVSAPAPVASISSSSQTPTPTQSPAAVEQPLAVDTSPPAVQAASVKPQPITLPWTFWLVLAWLSGCLLLLGHVALGYVSLWLLRYRCTRIEQGDWRDLLEKLRRDLRVHRRVELLTTSLRTMPMTWGLLRTRLLLPEQANQWPAQQRRSVLLHELAHVRRWDCLTQLLAQLACALYWFNPLVWVAWRRMQVERERACDDLVLNAGSKASDYAQHLLHSASAMPTLRFVSAAALAMARASTLEERLRTILDPKRNRGALSVRGAFVMMLLLGAAVIPVAVLRAQENQAAPPVQPPVGPTPAGVSNLSVDERLRLRREQDAAASDAAPATRPVARGGTGFDSGARGGGGPARGMLGRGSAPLAPGDGPTCTLDATIYDVRIPVNQIGRLDVTALTRVSATPEGFEQALAELGPALPLYRANQSVRLARDSITIGSNTPYIANATVSTRGAVVRTPAYASVGAVFSLAGKADPSGSVELDMSIDVSSLFEGTTEIAEGVKAPIFRTSTMSHKGIVQPRQPFVVMSIDANTLDANGKAVAYIARITLGAPQTGAAPARE